MLHGSGRFQYRRPVASRSSPWQCPTSISFKPRLWIEAESLQFQENSTEREQLGQRLIAGCQQQPRGRNAALCAIRLRSNATDHGRVHRLSSCMTGSMLSKRPSLAPRKDLLELECRMSEGRRPDPEGTTWCLTLKGHGRNVTINGLGWPLMTRSLP